MLKDLCFEVIHTCPNNCKFCSSNSSIGATKIISLDDFKRTVNHFMKNGGIEEISISGGEPFLHPDLMEMVRFCKSLNIRTVIFTSGIKRARTLSEFEKNFYIDEYNKKVQEVEEAEHWNTRINEIIKRNLKRQLSNVIDENFWAISRQEMDLLKSIGLDKIVFDYQAAEEQTYNQLMGSKELFRKVSLSMIRANSVGLNVDVHFVPMKPNYKQFPDILEELDIKYDGTVLPCPAFKEMSAETLEKYGIRLYNIYDDLESLVVKGGKRANPLCKQVYGFDYSLSSDDEER